VCEDGTTNVSVEPGAMNVSVTTAATEAAPVLRWATAELPLNTRIVTRCPVVIAGNAALALVALAAIFTHSPSP
jgi:hypothetical protein